MDIYLNPNNIFCAAERLDELKKSLSQEKSRYKKLKEEVLELSNGKSDHRLAEISLQIEG